MKSVCTRILAVLLLLTTVLGLALPVLAAEPEPVASKKVLLVEDNPPWDSHANETVLGKITEYTKVTTAGFLEVDLSEYGVIVFANDQPFSSYDNYESFKEYMEIFASIGGVIVFGACDNGWEDGILEAPLPGNVTKTNHYETNNYIEDYDHSIVTGALTDGIALVDDDLQSSYCSHISFNEDSFPAGTKVILRESTTNKPTLIEYPLGKGRVIASGLTWEHNYTHKGDSINGITVGGFAERALDDLYTYAIRVSSIDVDELHLLDEWLIDYNSHIVIAADASGGIKEMLPIAGAQVKIAGETFITDENGVAKYPEFDIRTVGVYADGFREWKTQYRLESRQSRIFYLEKQKDDGLPYLTQATGHSLTTGIFVDLKYQSMSFTQDSYAPMLAYFSANWSGHGAGKFVLYQEATAKSEGKAVEIYPGKPLTCMPGRIFSPNRQIKIKLVAGDGTESEPMNLNITIHKKVDPSAGGSESVLEEGLGQMDWIGNHPVKSDDDIFTKLLTADMSISSDLSPVQISRQHNEDGTVTYKGVIGLVAGKYTESFTDGENDKKDKDDADDADENGFSLPAVKAWDEWKKQIKAFKKAGNPKEYVKNLKKKYAEAWHPTTLDISAEVEGNFSGFFEITLNQENEIVSSDSGLIVEISGGFVFGQTFFAGSIPIYYEFKPGVKVSASGKVTFYSEDGWCFRPDFEGIDLSLPTISLEGGVGVSGVATLGLQGTGALVFGFLKDNKTTGTLELGGAIHAKVLFVVDYSWDFWNTKIPLWGQDKNKSLNAAISEIMEQTPNANLTQREYLNAWSEWDGNISHVSRAINGANMDTLRYGVMPDAMPVIHRVGDKLVMLMLEDDGTGMTGNHTRLVYSVCDGGYWTYPRRVSMTDTADFFFDSVVVNDRLYVAWQKSKTACDGENPEELLTQVAAGSEICLAVWNPDTQEFGQSIFVTDNDVVDMMPSLSAAGDEVSLAWISNDANALMGAEGSYSVRHVTIDGEAVGSIDTLYETSEYVLEMVNGTTDGFPALMYTAYGVDGTTKLYRLSGWQADQVQTKAEVAGLAFDNGLFTWHENGTIYGCEPGDTSAESLYAGAASSSYRYVTNGSKTAFVWTQGGETTSVLASICVDGVWCQPITLIEGIEETVNFFDVALLDDGSFALVLNTAVYSQRGLDSTAIKYAQVQPKTDISLDAAIAEAPDWETKTQAVTVYLQNLGDTPVDEVLLSVTYEGGILTEQTLPLRLLPGESAEHTIQVDISALEKTTDVMVHAISEGESLTANDTQQLTLAQVYVTIDCDTYQRDDELVFVFSVSNYAPVPANVALSIFEDKPDGIQLDVKNLGTITREKTIQYMYAMDKSKIDFGDKSSKTYFFSVSTLEEDWLETDNLCFYTINGVPNEPTDPNGKIEVVTLTDTESVKIDRDALVFASVADKPVQLTAQVLPADAAVQYVKWDVENADIVHITSTGLVTPLRPGKTSITATVMDGISHTITVTVNDPDNPITEQAGKKGGNLWLWICLGAGAVVLIVVVAIIIFRKKGGAKKPPKAPKPPKEPKARKEKPVAPASAEAVTNPVQAPAAPAPVEKPRFCTQCGTRQTGDALFCTECGAKLE